MFSLPSSIHGWKNQFFFVSFEGRWGFNTKWQEPDVGPNSESEVGGADRGDFEKLRSAMVPPSRKLLSDESLHYMGVSQELDEDFCVLWIHRSLNHRLTCVCAGMLGVPKEVAREAAQ